MIINISGKLGSGKDTLAKMLVKINRLDRLNPFTKSLPKFEISSFADRLKFSSALILNEPINKMYTQSGKNEQIKYKSFDMSLGKFLQVFGTDVCRDHLNDRIWIDSALNGSKMQKFTIFGYQFLFYSLKPNKNIKLFPDTRFKNEVIGDYQIRIEGDPNKTRENSNRDLNHISEIDLDDYSNWDIVIVNNSTLKSLYRRAKWIYKEIKKKYYEIN